MPQQIAQDLQLLNLPKYATKLELKKQFHKFAKMYHPDTFKEAPGIQLKKLEDRFKQISDANERLDKWISERDEALNDSLMNN